MRKILFIIPFFLWTCGGDESSPTEPLSLPQHGKMYGGTGREQGRDVKVTSDGGFILAGYTNSFGGGDYDAYVVKTDALGNEIWSQTFGGSSYDHGWSIKETSDGGFILAGQSSSFGAGDYDAYVVKTDALGNEIWSKTFGGSYYDSAYSIEETSDGEYIIGGRTRPDENEGYDMYLVKMDASGNEIWSQTFGEGSGNDIAYSMKKTSDGGFILSGYTESSTTGARNMYLVKTDASGNEMWSQILEVSSGCRSIEQTLDGGFILACNGIKLVKTDASGNEMWSQNFQGQVSGGNVGFYDLAISGGGYIMAGYTQTNNYSHDMYVIKTDASGGEMWRKTHGEEDLDKLIDPTPGTTEIGYSIDKTLDGGFILLGERLTGYGDMYLVKIDSEGNRIF